MSSTTSSESTSPDEDGKSREEWRDTVGRNFPFRDPERDIYYRVLRDGDHIPDVGWSGSWLVRVIEIETMETGETDESGMRETEERLRSSTRRLDKKHLLDRLLSGKYVPGHESETQRIREEYGPTKERFEDSLNASEEGEA